MEIVIEDLGKRYRLDWVFRHLSLRIVTGDRLAILGVNGSGKSTLLRIMAGLTSPSEGACTYGQRTSATEPSWLLMTFTAPYLELPEELTLEELVRHHTGFRALPEGIHRRDVPDLMGLAPFADRPVRQFSSGMKQRVRIGLAVLDQAPFLFLDEPLTNLDDHGKVWYYEMIRAHAGKKAVVVASNRTEEYPFCDRHIHMDDFKPPRPESSPGLSRAMLADQP